MVRRLTQTEGSDASDHFVLINKRPVDDIRSEQKNKSGTCERVQLWFEDVFMTGLESTLPFALDHPPVYLNLGGSYTLEDALRHSGNKSVFTIEKEQQLVAIETSSDIAPGADLILSRHAPPGLVILKVFNAGTCVPFGMQSLPLNLNNYSHISNDMKCFTLEGGILTESQEVKLIKNVLALQKEGKGSGKRPVGYYVSHPGGLFPAPLPQDSVLCDWVSSLFWVFGVFLAKVLQDSRLVDVPLSTPFLKLLCQVYMLDIFIGPFKLKMTVI